jgi:hypothetical protein
MKILMALTLVLLLSSSAGAQQPAPVTCCKQLDTILVKYGAALQRSDSLTLKKTN